MRRAIVIVVVALGLTVGLVAYAGGQQQSQTTVGTWPPMFAPQQTPRPTSASSPVALRLVNPTRLPTSSPTPVPRPLATHAASAAPATSMWPLNDCSFALSTMEEDESLDAPPLSGSRPAPIPRAFPQARRTDMIRFLAGLVTAACLLAAVNTLHGNPPLEPFTNEALAVHLGLSPAATPTPTPTASPSALTVPQLIRLPTPSEQPSSAALTATTASPTPSASSCLAFWIPWQGVCVPPEPVVGASQSEPSIPKVTWTPPPGWSAEECQTGVTMLAWDEALDHQSSLTDPTYYDPVVLEWASLEGWVWASCRTAIPMTAPQAGEGSSWIAIAVCTHYFDVRDHPQDASWDDIWVTAYGEIAAMLRVPL